jgi:hypothetical protein
LQTKIKKINNYLSDNNALPMRIPGLFHLILPAVFLLSCNPDAAKDRAAASGRITVFHGFPPGFEGCTCYFSAAENEFSDQYYLFVSDLDSLAYINVNEKPVKLKLVRTSRAEDAADEQDYEATYTNGTYTLITKVDFKEQTGDEAWWHTGTMKLYFKGVEIDQRNFMGECGC